MLEFFFSKVGMCNWWIDKWCMRSSSCVFADFLPSRIVVFEQKKAFVKLKAHSRLPLYEKQRSNRKPHFTIYLQYFSPQLKIGTHSGRYITGRVSSNEVLEILLRHRGILHSLFILTTCYFAQVIFIWKKHNGVYYTTFRVCQKYCKLRFEIDLPWSRRIPKTNVLYCAMRGKVGN